METKINGFTTFCFAHNFCFFFSFFHGKNYGVKELEYNVKLPYTLNRDESTDRISCILLLHFGWDYSFVYLVMVMVVLVRISSLQLN